MLILSIIFQDQLELLVPLARLVHLDSPDLKDSQEHLVGMDSLVARVQEVIQFF